ncbi:hypothetical protein MW887_002545 [Aspergillus wentii]|nr:hypothetical protein MW887_002545 [Aspergillus wentii]
MFGKLREKLRRVRKGGRGDDTTKGNSRSTNLFQEGRGEAAPERGQFRLEAAENANLESSKARNTEQKYEVKCLEEPEQDGVDSDVSPTSKQHSKGTCLEKERKSDDPEFGARALDRLKDGHEQDEAKTPECPVSETIPADEKAVERSDKPGNAGLWQRAFDELNQDLKGKLCEEKAMPLENAIQDVIDRTKENFEAYQNGGLKFKKHDGKEINVRDVAKKILNSAIHCSEIVKWIAASDPSGHASSAWAIISLGLTMAKNFEDQKEAAFKSSQFLADILARYVILDNYCRTEKLPSSDGLDNAILQVYKAILEYTAEVKKRQSTSFLNRIGNSIFPDSDTELAHLRSAVEDQDNKVRNWSQIHTLLYHSTKGDEILASIEKVYQNTETIKDKVNSDEMDKILGWLSDIKYSQTQDDNQRIRTDNTGDWLLCSDEYKQWKATPGKFLWLYGPAGCGKSILCSTVIQDIKKHCNNSPSSKLSYWYFQFSRGETQNVKNMTRTIIRQLVPEELPISLVNLWKKQSHQNSDPVQDEFSTVLNDVIECHMGDHLFLIFDALDECPDNEVRERDLLLRLLKGLIDKHGNKIHLLATSRVEEDIRCHLEENLNIDPEDRINLEDRMNDDVVAFVYKALNQGKLKRWEKNEQVKHEILAKLLNTHEQRHFRWTHLQIEWLGKCKKKAKILESLKEMPKSLGEMYHKIFQEIPEDEQEDARSILIWLSFSLTPLELETVAAVVAYPDPEDVVKTCTTSLVTVSPSDGTIKLAHFSVKEFLAVSNPTHWYQFTAIGGHAEIVNRALDDLLDKTEDITAKECADDLPLIKYASTYWNDHFSELPDSDIQFPALEEKICRLFEEDIVYLNWRSVARDDFKLIAGDIPKEHSMYNSTVEPPICLACEMGVQSVVERLLLQGADPFTTYEKGYYTYTTFKVAIWNGHLTIVKQRLKNVEISEKIAEDIVTTIDLRKASLKEVEDLLNILLSTDILYDKDENGRLVLCENFVIVTAENRSGNQLMSLLLDRQEQLEVPVTEEVLDAVARNTNCGEETMRMLCDRRGKDIQITERLMWTVAENSGRNPGIPTLVFEKFGATVPLSHWTISDFVYNATPEVMEFLLQIRGDKIQVTERLLLHVARYQRHSGVFQLLWKRAPGIEITGELLWRIARERKGLEYLEFLLRECPKGCFIDDRIVQRVAKSSSGLPLMQILLDKREAGLIAFHISKRTLRAAALNSRQMMDLVINNAGPDVSINEILCLLAGYHCEIEPVLKHFLELDENLPISEEILCSAAANLLNGESTILKYLLELDKSPPISEKVLCSATGNLFNLESILKFLIENGADLPITEKLLCSAAANIDQGKSALSF